MLKIPQFFLAALALVLVSCATPVKEEKASVPVQRYQMQGEILKVEPKTKTATIKHGEIKGWMEAMTMDFPVRDANEFARLKQGMRIDATVFVQDLDFWIGDIKPGNAPAPK